jgi:hypothetical protein
LRARRRLVIALLPLAVSWLLTALLPAVLTSIPSWNPYGGWPEVPFLLTPSASGGHVQSSVYYFVILLGGGLACAALVELSKYSLARHNGSGVPYFVLLVHQIVIIADVIRSNAWDWWTYLLSVVHLYEIDRWSWRHLHPSLAGRWPWPSAVSAIIVASIILFLRRDVSDGPEAKQREAENEASAAEITRNPPSTHAVP